MWCQVTIYSHTWLRFIQCYVTSVSGCAHWRRSRPGTRCYTWPLCLLAKEKLCRWCCKHRGRSGKAVSRLWLASQSRSQQTGDLPCPWRKMENAGQVFFFLFFHHHRCCLVLPKLHRLGVLRFPCSPSKQKSILHLSVSELFLQNIIQYDWWTLAD